MTIGGRITAVFIMFMGVGIIGVLASSLSSVLVGGSSEPEEESRRPQRSAPDAFKDFLEGLDLTGLD